MLPLEVVQLLLDDLGRLLLAALGLVEPRLHAEVIVLELQPVVLEPACLEGELLLKTLLFQIKLGLALLDHITEKHLGVECLNLILRVMCLLSSNL
jgi:hypothetical protein